MINKLLIKSKKRVFSAISGNHISNIRGDGLDFFELKEYEVGDNTKNINWKVTAKKSKPFVNVYNEEKELNILAIMLCSGNLHFGTKILKQDYIAELISLLGFSALALQDKFSCLGFSDKEEFFVKPSKKEMVVKNSFEEIMKINLLGKEVDFKSLSTNLMNRLKHRSIIFLIGDFLEDNIDLSVLSKKHEVIVLNIKDKIEEGGLNIDIDSFSDPLSLEEIESVDFSKYVEFIKDKESFNIESFNKLGIKYIKLYTDENPFLRLGQKL